MYDAGKDGVVGDHPGRGRPDVLFPRLASTEIGTRRGLFADADAEEVVLDLVSDRQVSAARDPTWP